MRPLHIWLDDERDPFDRTHGVNTTTDEVVWAKDFFAFKKAIFDAVEQGRTIGRISFDWYLGYGKLTGIDAAEFVLGEVEDGVLEGHPPIRLRCQSSDEDKRYEIAAIVIKIREAQRGQAT